MLKAEKMSKLYLISGNDEYAIKAKAVDTIREICGEDAENDPSMEIIKGDDDSKKADEILAELMNSLNTPPFLSPQKTVWLKHFAHFEKVMSGKANAREKERLDALSEFISSGIPEEINLVIDGSGIDRRKSFYKTCDQAGTCIFLAQADLTDRNYAMIQAEKIRGYCANAGINIFEDAVQFLTDTVGSDTARIYTELDKLFCYIGVRDNINLEDCRNICSRTPEALSWAFADALINRRLEDALITIDTLMEQLRSSRGSGNPELAILSLAVGNFQNLVKTRAVIDELQIPGRLRYPQFKNFVTSVPKEQSGNILCSYHPYRAFMLYCQAESFTQTELKDALNGLLNTYRHLVSGSDNSRLALEQLAFKIAGNTRDYQNQAYG